MWCGSSDTTWFAAFCHIRERDHCRQLRDISRLGAYTKHPSYHICWRNSWLKVLSCCVLQVSGGVLLLCCPPCVLLHRKTSNCIEKYDHYCQWVGNAIGKRNYRLFLSFITATLVYLLCFVVRLKHVWVTAPAHLSLFRFSCGWLPPNSFPESSSLNSHDPSKSYS